MKALRSLMFVPGHKGPWVEKALASGTDAVILDLEDSVPDDSKQSARRTVIESIDRLRDEKISVFVRPNAWDTDAFGYDLAAVVRSGLDGLLLPKIGSPEDLYRFDGLLSHLEIAAGIGRGSVEVIPSLETASSVARANELTRCPRVATLQSATARDGDIARDMGFLWSPEGTETLYLRSKAVLACRANRLSHPLCGVWQDISDIDGLRRFAEQNRALGFTGMLVLHPTHVAIVNDVFSVQQKDVERAQRMVNTYESGLRLGNASVMFEGEHIDTAHIKTARAVIELADKQRSSK